MEEAPKYTGRGGWRGGGRPKKEHKAPKKYHTMAIALLPDQKKAIQEMAKDADMSVSQFVLSRVFFEKK